jgi:glycosyltransferase involved in cell wall biosynthesis
MTVLWLNKRNWRHPGPIVNMAVHNAHSFASIGTESHFVAGTGEASDTDTDLRDFYGLEPSPRFHVHRVPLARRGPKATSSLPVFLHARRRALDLARSGQVAVFCRDSSFLPFLALLCRHPRIRGFYELHDYYVDHSWRGGRVPFGHHREQWLERLFLPRISGIVCITSGQKELYQKHFPRLPAIARNLGTKPFPPADAESRRRARTVFYVGHMSGSKGVAFLLEAATALAHRGIRTEFWGGYEKDTARIRAHAEKEGIPSMIRAESFRPPAELHLALAERGGLGVVMLANTFYNRHLTCPVKALDYLSHGMPALGTPLPCVQEVLGPAGHYLTEGDAAAFVEAATALFDDPAAYARACAAAQARATEITWQERARALLAFAQSLQD